MSRTPKKKSNPPKTTAVTASSPADFEDVLRLIDAARGRAIAAVNTELIDLYWNIGEHISRKLESAAWGEGIVQQLADTSPSGIPTSRASPPQPLPNAAVLRNVQE